MSRASKFLLSTGLGAAVTLLVQAIAVSGSAGAATVLQNGDVNGDGSLDLSDAAYLLNYLFKGGTAPVEIDCGAPEPGAPQVRFLNDLTCDGGVIDAHLEVCDGSSIAWQTNVSPSECQAVAAATGCRVRISGTAVCGSFELCADLDVEPGIVHDFVLTVNGGAPAALLFLQPAAADGSCPAFPTPGTPQALNLTGSCVGGGGGAHGSGAWAAAGSW